MVHELKCSSQYFDDVRLGIKPFEVRKDDRPYSVGDDLHLFEYDSRCYSGRDFFCHVTYVLRDTFYCRDGFVILGIKRV